MQYVGIIFFCLHLATVKSHIKALGLKIGGGGGGVISDTSRFKVAYHQDILFDENYCSELHLHNRFAIVVCIRKQAKPIRNGLL